MSTFDTYVHKITIIWYMLPDIWSAKDRIFCNFRQFFALLPHPPPAPHNPENQNFEKMKKSPGYIIILHTCTINDHHIMHGF